MCRRIVVLWISLVLLLSFVVLIIDIPQSVRANIVYVGGGGPQNHTTIQDGINASNDGDTVFVYSGIYNERVIVNKTINLIGEDKDTTIIDGVGGITVVSIVVNWVNISGFTICKGDVGLRIIANNVTVENCIFNESRIGLLVTPEIFYDDFRMDKGWTGYGSPAQWERGPAQSGGGDPGFDHSDSEDNYIVGNNISGCYQKNIVGTQWLTSPQIDCSGIYNVKFSFWRWLGVEDHWDDAYIDVYDGSSWQQIWDGSGTLDTNWTLQEFDVSSYADNNPLFRVRFGLGPTDFIFNYCGWNIDDVKIIGTPIRAVYNNIQNNIFESNEENGIYLQNSNLNRLENNTIFNNGNGIYLDSTSPKNIIIGNNASNNEYGISIRSNFNTIEGNNVSFNECGIYLASSLGNILTKNIMIKNGLFIEGPILEHWNTHNIDTSNTVNGKSLYYWKNQTAGSVPIDAGQIILANCTNTNIIGSEPTNGTVGIELGFSPSNNLILNNASSNNWYGIYLYRSDANTLQANPVSWNNLSGIHLGYSSVNTVIFNAMVKDGIWIEGNLKEHWNTHDIETSNTVNGKPVCYMKDQMGSVVPAGAGQIILGNCTDIIIENQELNNGTVGIELGFSSSNNIIRNNISGNRFGIYLYRSDYNNITQNNLSSNYRYGVSLHNSTENSIFHNNFMNNMNQAEDDRSSNYWDDGYPLGGNYWSDYTGVDFYKGPSQKILGSDGFGDTNYSIDSDSIDNYPLMEPYIYSSFENYTILNPGWNLISIPLIQNNQNLTKVLEMIDSYYDAVQWWDVTDRDSWKHHKVGKPYGNDLFELNESMGFWVYITQNEDTIFLHNGTQPVKNQTIKLHPGWNLVGYPSKTSYNRTEGLNNLTFGSEVDAVWTYNSTNQKWKEITASDYFEVGRGYWIHSKVTKVWNVPL